VEKKEWPHLEHAPIVEALIDIRVSLQPGFEANTFRKLYEVLKEAYPNLEEIHAFGFKGELNISESILNQEVADQVIGFRLKNADNTKLVQFRLDGFTFNHLKPYSDWDTFYNEAWQYWELYLKIAEPTEVTRIALRYINKQELPLGEELINFVKHPPSLDQAIHADLTAFLFHTQVKLRGTEDTAARVVQFTEPLAPNRGITYVLDIDTSKTGNFIPTDAESFKNHFDELRGFKNEIFFSTVTEKALDLWKS
jgi:uncharacterized protein (TIGR04255 family)